jgi:hypothetical protein
VATVSEIDTAYPDIAMDASGNAMAVFTKFDGSVDNIYYRRWNGNSWVWEVQPVGGNILGPVTSPSVAMAGDWIAISVFLQTDGAHNRAWCSRWTGTGWTQPTTIDAGPGNHAGSLEVALNAKGEAVAVFTQRDAAKDRVYANRWDGSAWSGAVTIDSGLWTKAERTAVAIDGTGRAVAAFTEFSETDFSVGPRKLYAVVYDGSAWSAPVRIDREADADSSDNPDVAMDPSGRAMVVFQQEDGFDKRVYANRYVFPARSSSVWNYDYNGDGTSEIAIFRETSGLWAIRGLTRAYFGRTGDLPVPGDYDGDGTTDIAIFRGSSGLWAVRGGARNYFGGSSDTPLPRDYDGDGTSDIAINRPATGLWAVRGITRVYFGAAGDDPVAGDYYGYGTAGIGIFRDSTGLWAARNGERMYFGAAGDLPVLAGYDSYPGLDPAIFRGTTSLWAMRGITRAYFGTAGDETVPADYDGDGVAEIGIFRESTGLWAIRGEPRVYFGTTGDLPVSR